MVFERHYEGRRRRRPLSSNGWERREAVAKIMASGGPVRQVLMQANKHPETSSWRGLRGGEIAARLVEEALAIEELPADPRYEVIVGLAGRLAAVNQGEVSPAMDEEVVINPDGEQ